MPAFRHWIAAREQIPGFTPSDPNALVHLIAHHGQGIARRDLGGGPDHLPSRLRLVILVWLEPSPILPMSADF
jgi:hypothetical protein